MLKAGALLYSVLLSFLIALISIFFILSAFFQNRLVDNQLQFEQVKANVNSSIAYFLSEGNLVQLNSQRDIDLFEDITSSVKLKYYSWGLYSYVSAASNWKHLAYKRKALIGDDIQNNNKLNLAIYLADHNNYLSVCGNSLIKGDVYLPKLGPKRAYIEGKSFSGKKLIEGSIRASENTLPQINKQILLINSKYLQGQNTEQDSIVKYEDVIELDSIVNPFSNKTLYIEVPNQTNLNNKVIHGNVILFTNGILRIDYDNDFRDIIIYANEIIVEQDFEGHLQLIAKHKIHLERNTALLYPSSICLIKNNDDKASEIIISDESLVEGSVLLINEKKDPKNKAILKIDKNATIHGQVYCNDLVEHKGSIHGSLYADQLILKTASSIYENHLLDANIDFSQLSPYFVGIDLFDNEQNPKKKMIKWLN